MALTEEQRERIRKNRERALQLQKQRKQQEENQQQQQIKKDHRIEQVSENQSNDNKRKKPSQNESMSSKSPKQVKTNTENTFDDPIEPFEEGASEWITKKEAMAIYCLPEGTLAVCECKEQVNPHNKAWAPMKLYRRVEIRHRAHRRYGGLKGLVQERNQRRERKFAKDFGGAKDIFK